ncbi:MAG TPA: hypothetical protein VKR24_11550, partial [Candidatus Limnocylindrales bacterium]|nr:hypothetical protein [Candidatus Limnocylindrales bacterium]
RKTRHLAAARFFESLGSDELAGALAGHYLAAHQNAPDGAEADALAGQARIALKSAADRAIALGAHAQAVKFLDQAVGVTRNESEQAELRLAAAVSAESAVEVDVSDAYYAEVAGWARANDDWSKLATAQTGRSRLLVNRAHVEPAIELLSSTIEELRGRVGDRELGQLYGQLARAQSLHDEPAAALVAADLGLAHAGRAHDAEVVADTLISKATALAGLGRVIEAVALLRGAIDLAERSGFGRIDLRARNNLSGFISVNDPREAREMLRIGLERARRLGEAGWVAALTLINAFGSFWLGEWDQLLRDIEQAEEESSEVVRGSLLVVVRSWVQAARGDFEAAEASVADANRQTEGQSSPTSHAYVRVYTPAWIALCAGRFDDASAGALTAARGSWEVIEESAVVCSVAAAAAGNPDVLEEIAQLLTNSGFSAVHFDALNAGFEASRLAIGGRIPEAGLAYSTSAELLRRLGYRVELALLAIARAQLIRPPDPATTDAVAEAREILTGLGALPLLKLLDDAVAGTAVPAKGAVTRPSSVGSPAST